MRFSLSCLSDCSYRWTSPPISRLKLNVDVGSTIGRRKVNCGVVIHDHLGNCLASSSVLVEALLTPSVAEALVILHGLIICSRLGFNNVIVEFDCQQICPTNYFC